MSEDLALKDLDGVLELGGVVAVGGGSKLLAVQLVLELAALLVAGFFHFLKEAIELRTAGERQCPTTRALAQEADGTAAGISEELAVKPLDSARELIVAGRGDGEARGVQLVRWCWASVRASSSSAASSCLTQWLLWGR
jgi:hypothetical protein